MLSIAPPIASLIYGLLYRRNIFSTEFIARVKYKETNPHAMPNRIAEGMRSIRNGSSIWNLNMASGPVRI